MIGFNSLEVNIFIFRITSRIKHSNMVKNLLEISSSYKQNKIADCQQKCEHNWKIEVFWILQLCQLAHLGAANSKKTILNVKQNVNIMILTVSFSESK